VKICILSTVHSVSDTRIFHTQAKSLVIAGFDVKFIVPHDKDEEKDGVKIIALPTIKNRYLRILRSSRILFPALKNHADVYHFHDPELLPVGVLLKILTGKKILFDVHENVKMQILTKQWLPLTLRRPLSFLYRVIEKLSLPFIDRIIIAEDSYQENYRRYSNKVLVIRNYPLLSYRKSLTPDKFSDPTLIYVGEISRNRGAIELIESVRQLKPKYNNLRLLFAGSLFPRILREMTMLIDKYELKENITLMGYIPHEEIYDILPKAHIGLAILHPIPNFIESMPTKLFQYMSNELPVITSDFPLWREIIEENKCGFTVDPLSPGEIAEAVTYLLDNPQLMKEMGENGKKAVNNKYNWETEATQLISCYNDLFRKEHSAL